MGLARSKMNTSMTMRYGLDMAQALGYMGMGARLKSFYRKLGRIEKAFALLVVVAVVLAYAVPSSFIGLIATFAAWIAGVVVAIRLARKGVTKLIWRLRN